MSILTAFINLGKKEGVMPVRVKDAERDAGTKINKVGDSLESFIDSLFGKQSVYSYIGNPNNPPDRILKNAEALEIKKVSNIRSDIALNSSSPKARLYADDSMLTTACRECEGGWKVRDMVYIIGVVENKTKILKNIWFIFGDCYAADNEIYEKTKKNISKGIKSIVSEEWAETRELGRLNKVDPLGITYLRLRGMWGIQHPQKVFEDSINMECNAFMLMKEKRFSAFEAKERNAIPDNVVKRIKIKSPNNPAKKMGSVLLQKTI